MKRGVDRSQRPTHPAAVQAIKVHIARRDGGAGLNFPDFEDGRDIWPLVDALATALRARPLPRPSLDLFVGFEGYPEPFELWWDGFTCELACAKPCSVDIDEVLDQLIGSTLFVVAEAAARRPRETSSARARRATLR